MSSTPRTDHFDTLSKGLARRGLILTLALAWFGAALGMIGALFGTVTGIEAWLVS
jgi:hypothetical protein